MCWDPSVFDHSPGDGDRHDDLLAASAGGRAGSTRRGRRRGRGVAHLQKEVVGQFIVEGVQHVCKGREGARFRLVFVVQNLAPGKWGFSFPLKFNAAPGSVDEPSVSWTHD